MSGVQGAGARRAFERVKARDVVQRWDVVYEVCVQGTGKGMEQRERLNSGAPGPVPVDGAVLAHRHRPHRCSSLLPNLPPLPCATPLTVRPEALPRPT